MKSDEAMRHVIEAGQAGIDAGIDLDVALAAISSVDPREFAKVFAGSPKGMAHLRRLAHLASATLAEAERLAEPDDQRRGAEILGRRV